MDLRPIGIFDSGFGGISVLGAAMRQLPREDFVYYGDNANAPYGSRSEKEIIALTFACARKLMQHGVKVIVIACNTATSAAITDIRRAFALPVLSMEPAIKPACASAGSGHILMLATPATIAQPRYRALLARQPLSSRVINVPCPDLARCVETDADCRPYLREYLAPYAGATVDAIVLGCTHYLFVSGEIAAVARETLQGACALFDGNEGTARHLLEVLSENGMQNTSGGSVTLLTSGDEAQTLPRMRRMLERARERLDNR